MPPQEDVTVVVSGVALVTLLSSAQWWPPVSTSALEVSRLEEAVACNPRVVLHSVRAGSSSKGQTKLPLVGEVFFAVCSLCPNFSARHTGFCMDGSLGCW